MPSRWVMPRENFPARLRATPPARPARELVDPAPGDVVGLGQRPQMVVGAAAGVHGLGLEEPAHLAQRPGQVVVAAAVDGDTAAVGAVEPHDHAHGGGLARAVGTEETRDLAGPDVEGQAVDGQRGAVALGQTRASITCCHWSRRDRAGVGPCRRGVVPDSVGHGGVPSSCQAVPWRGVRPRARSVPGQGRARLSAGGGARPGRTGRRGRRPRRRAASCPRRRPRSGP